MNFNAINKLFGETVHVWGICAFKTFKGEIKTAFIPIKKLYEFLDTAREVQLVAQSQKNMEDFHVAWVNFNEIYLRK